MASFSLNAPARCLVAVSAASSSSSSSSSAAEEEGGVHCFLAGTCHLRALNELRLLRYSEEDESLACAAAFGHRHEVLALASSPASAALAATVYSDVATQRAAVWRLPGLAAAAAAGAERAERERERERGGGGSAPEPTARDLELVAELPSLVAGACVEAVQWGPGGAGGAGGGSAGAAAAAGDGLVLVAASRAGVCEVRLRQGGGAAASAALSTAAAGTPMLFGSGGGGGGALGAGAGFASHVGGVAWDPHHASEVAVAVDGAVQCWDLRAAERPRCLEHAVAGAAAGAGGAVRALSYNPNRPWVLASGGDDHRVKCWDLRRAAAPLKVLEGHTHWVTSLAFNPFHDQLLVSASTDAAVNLWRVSSISSAPLLELDAGDGEAEDAAAAAAAAAAGGAGTTEGVAARSEPRLAADAAIRVQHEHSDAVHAVAWSASSAWLYASLDYSGKAVVSQVPSTEKYKILL